MCPAVRQRCPMTSAPSRQIKRWPRSRCNGCGTPEADLDGADLMASTVRLLGFSTAAADFFVRHPDELATLADVSTRDRAALDAELATDVTALGLVPGLRRFRQRAMARVAAHDLGGAGLEDVVREISDIADACLAVAAANAGSPLAIIALGKLGGRELNFASDVDLLFVHADPGHPVAGRGRRCGSSIDRALGRADRGRHRRTGRSDAASRGARRCPEPLARSHPRVLPGRVRHVGAAGDAEGAACGRGSSVGLSVRGTLGADRVPGAPRTGGDR